MKHLDFTEHRKTEQDLGPVAKRELSRLRAGGSMSTRPGIAAYDDGYAAYPFDIGCPYGLNSQMTAYWLRGAEARKRTAGDMTTVSFRWVDPMLDPFKAKRRILDPQRARCYAWEDTLESYPEMSRQVTLDEAWDLAAGCLVVWYTSAVKAESALKQLQMRVSPRIRGGRCRWDEITIGARSMRASIVVHEVCHFISFLEGTFEIEHHNASFVSRVMLMYSGVIGLNSALLRSTATDAKLRY